MHISIEEFLNDDNFVIFFYPIPNKPLYEEVTSVTRAGSIDLPALLI